MSDDYLVGIFDGEGCITASPTKTGNVHLRCSVEMGNLEVITALKLRFGGGISTRKDRGIVRRQQLWQWYLSAGSAVEFLALIKERGIVKKAQAELAYPLAISAASYLKTTRLNKRLTTEEKQGRHIIMSQLRSLNGARGRYTVT